MNHEEADDAVLSERFRSAVDLAEVDPSPTEPIDISALINQQTKELS